MFTANKGRFLQTLLTLKNKDYMWEVSAKLIVAFQKANIFINTYVVGSSYSYVQHQVIYSLRGVVIKLTIPEMFSNNGYGCCHPC